MLEHLLLSAVLLALPGIQQLAQAKPPAFDTSCMFDPEEGVIPDCLQESGGDKITVTPQVLQQLHFDSHGFAVVMHGPDDWMYISRAGSVVIRGVPTMDNGADDFHDGLVRVIRNDKYGFSNRKGQLVIPAVYDGALAFEASKAKVCKGCKSKCVPPDCEYHSFSGGQWFEIDIKGTVISRIREKN